MVFILIATVAIGLGAAGLMLALTRLSGGRAPRWAAPVAAGLAMVAFMLWNEYTWYDRARESLPQGAVVAETYPYSSVFQPWTLVVPRVARFAVVGVPSQVGDSGLTVASVILIERLEPPQSVLQLFDCAGARRALLAGPGEGGPLALPDDPPWVEAGADDPLIRAACESRHHAEETDGEVRASG